MTWEAAAFAPGHVTAFFEVCDAHPDPARKGSRGAGFSLSLGVVSHVRAEEAEAQEVRVWLDGEPSEASTTARAVRLLLGRTPLRVEVRSEVHLPVGQGFGMSGAGALSAALALAKALRLPKSDAVLAAHRAEVEERTGLGDVVAQVLGGVEVRREPGLAPWGSCERVVGDAELVLAVVGEPLSTRAVLGSEEARQRLQKAGRVAMQQFLQQPTLPSLVRLGRQFCVESGLATEPVLRAIRAVEREGGLASQSMLGHSVFALGSDPARIEEALKPFGETFRCRVDASGARVLTIERAGQGAGAP